MTVRIIAIEATGTDEELASVVAELPAMLGRQQARELTQPTHELTTGPQTGPEAGDHPPPPRPPARQRILSAADQTDEPPAMPPPRKAAKPFGKPPVRRRQARPVRCVQTGKVYASTTQAEQAVGKKGVGCAATGGTKCAGFHWAWADKQQAQADARPTPKPAAGVGRILASGRPMPAPKPPPASIDSPNDRQPAARAPAPTTADGFIVWTERPAERLTIQEVADSVLGDVQIVASKVRHAIRIGDTSFTYKNRLYSLVRQPPAGWDTSGRKPAAAASVDDELQEADVEA